ncbi:MAG: nucleotidyl transferase AbiEii/AbiGii toxin family protein [Methylomonas sp.]
MSNGNLAASVRGRLLNYARAKNQDFNLVLTRYAIERMLYRISISKYAEQFLLKGALLFDIWFDIPHRSTRDADFLGFGSSALPDIEQIFTEICKIDTMDGVAFQSDTVRASEIRKEANYSGARVILLGLIDGARCQVQVDIGFGDAVTPEPENAEYPIILREFAPPKLRVYPRYTVVAEKFEALTSLGIANSRMKDYFDLWVLASYSEFDGEILRQAIQATFARRKTNFSDNAPFGLTLAFVNDRQKQIQWLGFLRKNKLEALTLNEVVSTLTVFIMPVVHAAKTNDSFPFWWQAGGSWLPENMN